MIIKNAKRSGHSSNALDYNFRKCAAGLAKVVSLGNMLETDFEAIYYTFDKIESNPLFTSRANRFCVHFSVNPSETDPCTEDDCLELIQRLLEKRFLDDNPYVIFRHFDLEREHYHVVSTRATWDGKLTNDGFSNIKTLACLRENEAELKYVIGKNPISEIEDEDLDVEHGFNKNLGKTVPQLKKMIQMALEYQFVSDEQFFAACEKYGAGVKFVDRLRAEGKVAMVQGLNKKNVGTSTFFNTRKDMDNFRVWEKVQKLKETNRFALTKTVNENCDALGTIVKFALENTETETHFRAMLRHFGVTPVFNFSEDRKKGEILDVNFVLAKRKVVLNAADISDYVPSRSILIERKKYWDETKTRNEEAPSKAFTEEQTEQLKVLLEAARVAMSERIKPDKEEEERIRKQNSIKMHRR